MLQRFINSLRQRLTFQSKSRSVEFRDYERLYSLFGRFLFEHSDDFKKNQNAVMPSMVKGDYGDHKSFSDSVASEQLIHSLTAFRDACNVRSKDMTATELTPDEMDWPWALRVRPSTVDHPESGLGVFIEGNMCPGTVVCVYPGTVYLPYNSSYIPGHPNISANNGYLMCRHDGNVIDGKIYDAHDEDIKKPVEDDSSTHDQFLAQRHAYIPGENGRLLVQNPFALGNMINHPAPGGEANVMPMMFDVPKDFPEDLSNLIPNRMYKGNIVVSKLYPHTVATILLVSTRHISNGEELFLDYRYNPSAVDIPEWFSPIDKDECTDRWSDSNSKAWKHKK